MIGKFNDLFYKINFSIFVQTMEWKPEMVFV